MPRLDNGSDKVIERFELEYDPEDPGATRTLDFCADCWLVEIISRGWEGMEIEHPSYEGDSYRCFICGGVLLESDDRY